MATAGWPAELIPPAEAVACGIGNQSGFPNGESGCHPGSVSSGGHRGLFQIAPDPWANYCGVSAEALLDALTNARCAWLIVLYDRATGQPDWAQWSVKP